MMRAICVGRRRPFSVGAGRLAASPSILRVTDVITATRKPTRRTMFKLMAALAVRGTLTTVGKRLSRGQKP